jgi:phage shock protein A
MDRPNPQLLAQHFRSCAQEVEKLDNLPAFNQGQPLLAAIQRIEVAMTAISTDVTALRTDVTALRTDMTALRTDMTALGGRFDTLQLQVTAE